MQYIQKFLLIVLFLLASVQILPQDGVVGKIIPKNEAYRLFGNVTQSVSFSTDQLISLLPETEKYVMFQFINGNIYVLGDKRKVLFPENGSVENHQVFHLLSKSILLQLFIYGKSSVTFIEKRGNILTISNGDFTLEYTYPCPPYCSPQN
ncbi:MAG: hypothetical protein AB9882_10685 [Ignavibacteriaceae bacterium]